MGHLASLTPKSAINISIIYHSHTFPNISNKKVMGLNDCSSLLTSLLSFLQFKFICLIPSFSEACGIHLTLVAQNRSVYLCFCVVYIIHESRMPFITLICTWLKNLFVLTHFSMNIFQKYLPILYYQMLYLSCLFFLWLFLYYLYFCTCLLLLDLQRQSVILLPFYLPQCVLAQCLHIVGIQWICGISKCWHTQHPHFFCA
jgi:hypothetical protein